MLSHGESLSLPAGVTVMGNKMKWVAFYGAMALLTLLFQIWVRSFQCSGFEDCGLSFIKAAVWAVIWPASWAVYLPGVI
jgi:hypothetical protein